MKKAGPSEDSQPTNRSKAKLHDEGGANKVSEYCMEALRRGREELSFEELRAERFNQRKQEEMSEKLRLLKEQQEQLSRELEEKRRLLQLHKPEQLDSDRPAASFQILEESASGSEEPAGNWSPRSEPPDDVFLRPEERGLSLRVRLPRLPPGQNLQRRPAPGQPGRTETELKTEADSDSSKPVLELSPIQEASMEAGSPNSPGERSARNPSPLDQNQQHGPSSAPDPCDPELQRRLMQLCDITSSADVKREQRPLPAVEENSLLDLGGDTLFIEARCLDGGSFSLFRAEADGGAVLLKVDRSSAPWDVYLLQRLKESPPPAGDTPHFTCFLFVDGCITVYTPPTDHLFTVLADGGRDQMCVGVLTVGLLELVLQLGWAPQPGVITSCHRGLWEQLLAVDWSPSLDRMVQEGVASVQQLLKQTDAAHKVDLVGVAETVYFLTKRKMTPVKDESGWTVEQSGGDGPRDLYSAAWQRFFRSLLNAGGRSSICILSELRAELSALYL